MLMLLSPYRIIYMQTIVINSQVPYNGENNSRSGNSEHLNDVPGSQTNEESHRDQCELKQTRKFVKIVMFNPNKAGLFRSSFCWEGGGLV